MTTIFFVMIGTLSFGYYVASHTPRTLEKSIKQQPVEPIENQLFIAPNYDKPQQVLTVEKYTEEVAKTLKPINVQQEAVFTQENQAPYKEVSELLLKMLSWRTKYVKGGWDYTDIDYKTLLNEGLDLKEGQNLSTVKDMIYNSKTYHIDLIKNKFQVKVSNIFKQECNYLSNRMVNNYNIKIDKKILTDDNINSICEHTNEITIQEK